MILFCTFCIIMFFIKGKVKFHEPKGIFVLATYFYACFGMSSTLDIIKGDKTVPEELINVIILTFIPLIFMGFKKHNYLKPVPKSKWDLIYLKWIFCSTIVIESPTFIGIANLKTAAITVVMRPSSNLPLYLCRYLFRYCSSFMHCKRIY